MTTSTYACFEVVMFNISNFLQTDTVISHPSVVFYDFYAAYNSPIATDQSSYLSKRTGILAQAAPNIGPMFWEIITGADGIQRQLQWTARVEGSLGATNGSKLIVAIKLTQKCAYILRYNDAQPISRSRIRVPWSTNNNVVTHYDSFYSSLSS